MAVGVVVILQGQQVGNVHILHGRGVRPHVLEQFPIVQAGIAVFFRQIGVLSRNHRQVTGDIRAGQVGIVYPLDLLGRVVQHLRTQGVLHLGQVGPRLVQMVQVLLPQQLQGTQPLHCAEAVPQGELILGVLGKVPGKGPVGQVLPLGVQVPGQSPLLGLRIVLRRLHPGPHRKGHQQSSHHQHHRALPAAKTGQRPSQPAEGAGQMPPGIGPPGLPGPGKSRPSPADPARQVPGCPQPGAPGSDGIFPVRTHALPPQYQNGWTPPSTR